MEIEGPPGRAVVVGKRKSRWSQVWTKKRKEKESKVKKESASRTNS